MRATTRKAGVLGAVVAVGLGGAAVLASSQAAATNTTYYVDCSSTATPQGTLANPWNALSQVNAVTFGPGDQVLFKRGTTCTGQFVGHGSGVSGSPITVAEYGAGSAQAVIDGAGATQAVHLKDVSHWTVKDMRLTNPSGTRAQRDGIRVETSTSAAKAGIVIDNLEIDNVAGLGDKDADATGFSRSAGILVLASSTAGPIDGIRIVNNYVHDTGGGGIKINTKPSGYHTNVYIGSNRIISAGGDGIVVHGSDAPLIELNRADNLGGGAYPFVKGNFAGMWPINSKNPVFQFNEVTRSYPSAFDSTAWDCDGAIVGTCTYQYNYSSNNAGGFHLGCQTCTSLSNYNAKEIIRFNVSQDDCRVGSPSSGYYAPMEFYNNTFFCSSKKLSLALPTTDTKIYNNVFYAAEASFPTGAGVTYGTNLYWGGITPPAADTTAVTADPKLNYPGGAVQIGSTGGYKLTTGSPALNAGTPLAALGARDFWNVAVPKAGGTVNIGADNGSGVAAKTYSSLKEAFNNFGITKNVNPQIGGLTLSDRSFSAEALAAKGFAFPQVTSGGVTFDWPQQYIGFPDNVKAAGQKITLSGAGTKVAILGTATGAGQSGTGTLHYTDGTTSTFTLSFSDWWSSTPVAGTTVAATTDYHHKKPTTYYDPATGRDEQDVTLFQSSAPITAGKTVAAITLPDVGGPLATPGLHVFAMKIA